MGAIKLSILLRSAGLFPLRSRDTCCGMFAQLFRQVGKIWGQAASPCVFDPDPGRILAVVLSAPGGRNVCPPGPPLGEIRVHTELQLIPVTGIQAADGQLIE
jgi:hypothetical protein